MSVARFAPLLSALCLSACAAGPPGEAVGHYPAAGDKPGGDAPLASLPAAAGRVVAVRRTSYVNGIGQDIVLEGPRAMVGENRITVQAVTTSRTGARGAAGDELKIAAPSDVATAAEMERDLPGLTMTIAATPERDAAGTVGYATGSRGRLSCLYAWQYIASDRPLSVLEGLSDTGVLPVSVRVRLCREQPLSTLIEELRGLRVTRSGGGLQLVSNGQTGTGDALDAAVGSSSASPSPDGVGPVEPEAPRPKPRVTRRRAVQHRAALRRRMAMRARPKVAEAPASVLPRLPIPDEVQPRAAPQRAPTSAMPLPGDAGDALSRSL